MHIPLSNRASTSSLLRTAEQALALLRWLAAEPGSVANDELAASYLAAVGLPSSQEALHANLEQLQQLGLITIRHERALRVITLTTRGEDVAAGRALVEGVRRPGPECTY